MEFEATSTAAPAEDPDTAPRGRRILANTVALLILAGAAGVLTPLVVQTDGFSLASWIRGAAPKSSQDARTAEVSTTEARPAAERESRTVDALARELAFAQEEMPL